MPGKPIVVLEDIVDQLEEATQSWEQYLNTETGEFVGLSDGTFIETDDELAEKIENSCCYIRLPNQYDLHEYKIMEDFVESIDDVKKSEKLFRA